MKLLSDVHLLGMFVLVVERDRMRAHCRPCSASRASRIPLMIGLTTEIGSADNFPAVYFIGFSAPRLVFGP
jgi:hypothetical protein